MQELIKNLDDVTAVRVLQTFSAAQCRRGNYETQMSEELRQGLLKELEGSELPDAVNEGDLAREALLILVSDQNNHEPLTALIESSSPEKFLDAGTIAIGVAALVALQTYVKFERTKEGKIHFKLERKPLPSELIGKLISFFTPSEGK
jgi:hypothetical protein